MYRFKKLKINFKKSFFGVNYSFFKLKKREYCKIMRGREYDEEEYSAINQLKEDLKSFRAKVLLKTQITICPASIFVEEAKFGCIIHADEYIQSHLESWPFTEEEKEDFVYQMKEHFYWKSSHLVALGALPNNPGIDRMLGEKYQEGYHVEGMNRFSFKEGVELRMELGFF